MTKYNDKKAGAKVDMANIDTDKIAELMEVHGINKRIAMAMLMDTDCVDIKETDRKIGVLMHPEFNTTIAHLEKQQAVALDELRELEIRLDFLKHKIDGLEQVINKLRNV